MKKFFIYLISILCSTPIFSQNKNSNKEEKDSLYIEAVENKLQPDKVLHAEPLYIDLIRDLGARKGEKEWNIGFELKDNYSFDSYNGFVEYEWAVIDRLGLEIEVPFTFYSPNNSGATIPENAIDGLKLATQYSFYVSEKNKTTLAIAYLNEFELPSFSDYGESKVIIGNIYNPFFVAAKRWGNNFHTLLYTGPVIEHHFKNNEIETIWQINSSFHYMIPGTSNFIGVEFNKEIHDGTFDMVIRPQMRVGIIDNLLIGIVTGIPISKENERFSTFFRLIYEPNGVH
ncbi:hypothetical protein MCETHM1_00919 [Flavobacteriaceae bacterium]